MVETTSHIFLIMEFLHGGNLKHLIDERRKNNKSFTNEEIRFIMKGIVNAVQYLHENDIVHRDIKSGIEIFSFRKKNKFLFNLIFLV